MIMHSSPFRRILVGANGEPESERAVEVAISLAKSLGAQVIVLGVIAPLSAETQAEGVGLEEASNAYIQVQEQVRKSAAAAHELGVDVVSEVVDGDPEKEIERKSDEISADLIVVGHRDINRVRRWLEGSTSETLVQISKTSVLVVHDDRPKQ
jgi:nucleotide-binding universal stress UspA family protein